MNGTKNRKKSISKEFVTQQQFADLWGVSQSLIAQFISRGVLTPGGTRQQWDAEMRKHYSELAAQHKSDDGIDAVKEGALLKRAQREEIEIKLAQLRRELWPINAIAHVLHTHNTNAKNRWLALPTTFKSICPHISARDIDRLDLIVRENLADTLHDQLPPDIRSMVQRFFEELHAAAEANSEPVGGPLPPAKPRKQRRSRPVAHSADAISQKDHG